MAIDDNASYELTGYQVKDLANKVRGKADAASLASVATSGLYSDLTGKPTIPTVNNGTLTIQHNGTSAGTFTANQSTNATVNIETIYADDYIDTTAITPFITTAMVEDGAVTAAKLAADVMSAIYPVGSIYMSATMSTAAQVEAAFGGTWVAWGSGRVPVGVDANDADFDATEETGGEKTHTLQPSETPERSFYVGHIASADNCYGAIKNVTHGRYQASGTYLQQGQQAGSNAASHSFTFGGGGAHNNLQPYITCYMYKRTA